MDQISINVRQASIDQWSRLSLWFFVGGNSHSSMITTVLLPKLAVQQPPFLHFLPSISQLLPTKNFLCHLSRQNEILSRCHLRLWCQEGRTGFWLLHCLGRKGDQANGHLMRFSQQMLICPAITWHKHSFNE